MSTCLAHVKCQRYDALWANSGNNTPVGVYTFPCMCLTAEFMSGIWINFNLWHLGFRRSVGWGLQWLKHASMDRRPMYMHICLNQEEYSAHISARSGRVYFKIHRKSVRLFLHHSGKFNLRSHILVWDLTYLSYFVKSTGDGRLYHWDNFNCPSPPARPWQQAFPQGSSYREPSKTIFFSEFSHSSSVWSWLFASWITTAWRKGSLVSSKFG